MIFIFLHQFCLLYTSLADKSYQLILTDNTRVYVDTFVDEEKYNQMYRLYKKLKAQHTDFKTVELRYKDITTRQ